MKSHSKFKNGRLLLEPQTEMYYRDGKVKCESIKRIKVDFKDPTKNLTKEEMVQQSSFFDEFRKQLDEWN